MVGPQVTLLEYLLGYLMILGSQFHLLRVQLSNSRDFLESWLFC